MRSSRRWPWLAYVLVIGISIGCTSQADGPGAETPADGDMQGNDLTCSDGAEPCFPDGPTCAHPWELPLVDGGCLAIGPQACPAGWEERPGTTCTEGELLPCGEGFEPLDDGAGCAPVFDDCPGQTAAILGGGCAPVGPGEGTPMIPVIPAPVLPNFVTCQPGLLATVDGGCVPTGPRACGKTWDPAADCVVEELRPCPSGWSVSEDGIACVPGYVSCGPGERPEANGECQRVVPPIEECGDQAYPEAGGLDAPVVYVNVLSDCVDGCGSQEHPFPSLGAAITAVPEGGYVLLAPGSYPGGVRIDKPLHLWGACATSVTITGSTLILGGPGSKMLSAGIAIVNTSQVEVTDLQVVSSDAGVALFGATDVHLERLDIHGGHGVALYVDQAAEVQAEHLWIHDTGTGSGQLPEGTGLWAGGGSLVDVSSSLVASARRAGIRATGDGTAVTLSDTSILETQADYSGWAGYGLQVSDGATLQATRILVDSCRTAGIWADSGSTLTLQEAVIRETQPDDDDDMGVGVLAMDGTRLEVTDSWVSGNVLGGLALFGANTVGEVTGTTIRKTKPDPHGNFGTGIQATDGATLIMEGGLLEENHANGLDVSGPGTQASLNGLIVRRTLPNGGGSGTGLETVGGAVVHVDASLFEDNLEVGILMGGVGTVVTLQGVAIRGTKSSLGIHYGKGIQIGDGATLEMTDSLVEGTEGNGVVVFRAPSLAWIRTSSIRGTEASAAGAFGWGIGVSDGAELVLQGSTVSNNLGLGIGGFDQLTTVSIADSAIGPTLPNLLDSEDPNLVGLGIQASGGCALVIENSRIFQSFGAGAVLSGAGTTGQIFGAAVVDTYQNGTGVFAFGIQATSGAAVELRDTVLADNEGVALQVDSGASATVAGSLVEENVNGGLVVFEEGSSLTVDGCTVRNTRRNADGKYGAGFAADLDAALEIQGSRVEGSEGFGIGCSGGSRCIVLGTSVEGNSAVGVSAVGAGTTLTMKATAILDTLVDEDGTLGRALNVFGGASATVEGSLFAGNSDRAVAAFDPGTILVIEGSTVRDTLPAPDGTAGRGLNISGGTLATIRRCLLERNTSTGLAIYDAGTEVTFEEGMIRDTRARYDGILGRGIQAGDGCSLVVRRSSLQGNRELGVMGTGAGTDMLLQQVTVRDTMFDGFGEHGHGLHVQNGAALRVSGCIVEDSGEAGVAAYGPGTRLTLAGSIVQDTRYGSDGSLGIGVVVLDGAEAEVNKSLLVGNATVGAMVYETLGGTPGSPARMSLSRCAVLRTAKGGRFLEDGALQVFGDGVFAAYGADLLLDDTVVRDNARAGAYYYRATGAVRRSLISGNQSYGLALFESRDEVTYLDEDNTIQENGLSLRGAWGVDISLAPEGIPPPAPPKLDLSFD